MRTTIDIDDALMDQALKAGPFKTKKEAVEAGLKLLARRTAYREVLKWRGKLRWEGDESIDWVAANKADAAAREAHDPAPLFIARATESAQPAPLPAAPTANERKARRARR